MAAYGSQDPVAVFLADPVFSAMLSEVDPLARYVSRVVVSCFHCVPPFRCWGLTSDRSGGRRRAAPGLDFGPSWPEAKQKKCARTARRYADA